MGIVVASIGEDEIKKMYSLDNSQGCGERILVVEDDEAVRKSVTRVLSENGHVVFEAARVKEARDIFEREKEVFDLVFSDIGLPDGNGLELIDWFLTRRPELPVLLATSGLERESQWSVIHERRFQFIIKPYSADILLEAVREAMGEVK